MVPGDSDLETCRDHIQRLQEVSAREEGRWRGGDKKVTILCLKLKKGSVTQSGEEEEDEEAENRFFYTEAN